MSHSIDTPVGRRNFLKLGAASFAGFTASCGYVLYPERKGNSGNIDTLPFVVDLLWLLPGLVPGVICLIVDFTTGCVYRGGGSGQNAAPQDGSSFAVVILDGKTVAKSKVDPENPTKLELVWNKDVDAEAARDRGVIVFTRKDAMTATALLRKLDA